MSIQTIHTNCTAADLTSWLVDPGQWSFIKLSHVWFVVKWLNGRGVGLGPCITLCGATFYMQTRWAKTNPLNPCGRTSEIWEDIW